MPSPCHSALAAVEDAAPVPATYEAMTTCQLLARPVRHCESSATLSNRTVVRYWQSSGGERSPSLGQSVHGRDGWTLRRSRVQLRSTGKRPNASVSVLGQTQHHSLHLDVGGKLMDGMDRPGSRIGD